MFPEAIWLPIQNLRTDDADRFSNTRERFHRAPIPDIGNLGMMRAREMDVLLVTHSNEYPTHVVISEKPVTLKP